MKMFSVLFVSLSIVVVSCSGMIPFPTNEQVNWASQRWQGVNQETLLQGRQLYITKCSGCHSLKVPANYTEAHWDSVMIPMGASAKLSKDEYELVLRYVTTMSN